MNLEEPVSFSKHGESRLMYPGPVAWCNMCSRVHPRRACRLVQAERTAKSGKIVTRWVHPDKTQKKTKARKS